jgi:hypothetical protein
MNGMTLGVARLGSMFEVESRGLKEIMYVEVMS